MSRNSFYF